MSHWCQLSFIFKVNINCSKGFSNGISHMHILYFYQINLLHFSLPRSPLPPIIQKLSVSFIMPSLYRDAVYLDITHPLSFSFPFHPYLVLSNSPTIISMQRKILFFFGGGGTRVRCLTLARQALYHLSHSASPFSVLGVFESLMNYLPGLAWNPDPPDLCLPSS
jgi:hypothetical protein